MSSADRSTPPYLRIVEDVRARIESGELRPGARMLSIRQIAQRWGVAVATATRAMAALRDAGLVETRVGAGTVIATPSIRGRRPDSSATPRPRAAAAGPVVHRQQVLATAIAIADAEGLEAVTMRRLAAELGVGPMSLYRHVAGKDELVTLMADEVFGEAVPPTAGPTDWRARLELLSRSQWELCKRHHWLPRAISFTRPLRAPNMMAHTEWTLAALDGLGLSLTSRMHAAMTLHAVVVSVALAQANEIEAEQETGVTHDRWRLTQREQADDLLRDGRFPLLASVPEDAAADLDGRFEYGLARHLDGLAVLVGSQGAEMQ
ncbi:TetR/AcrR family transcriptional regulator C-terminal domain-containing protein [Actinoalloteichus hymeniacidonis]|uniref:Transcriptional regulator, TetR family n=1 Tax=Actinoalloteichus hymeniacidonis TaxID=340345 RepID=A0AAC9N108_9PSEU|nr:TetR/AcrR family transcriptional regulator C-terminal domain-containing protein [Actinoalloteichus hymeniacidonis]AOS65642.1 transcriptional regulator, TetR family [Actinoalloteichus hymeniacidonis]MBB5906268.1 DNA-binding transcriptional regulator YhcF (GntR family) [Actinoalloteichus hymeniacidonis]